MEDGDNGRIIRIRRRKREMGRARPPKKPRQDMAAVAMASGNIHKGSGGSGEAGHGGGFFCCYLLHSLCPRRKGHTYIGFTVNPRRRIRQHNGEIRSGAWRTKRGRPWEMVLCIYGFPSNVSALQFEWAWQHPTESLAVRKAASSFKSLGGTGNKVKLAYTMLNLPSWENLNLTVNFFSTKYTKFTGGCPGLPGQMKTVICPMEDLPCYGEGCLSEEDGDEPQRNQESDVLVGIEPNGLQLPSKVTEYSEVLPFKEGIRSTGCESEDSFEEFAPMEWSGFLDHGDEPRLNQASDVAVGVEPHGLQPPSEAKESSEVLPSEENIRITRCDSEDSVEEFAPTKWNGILEREELERCTSPHCSSSSCSDNGERIVIHQLGQKSPTSQPEAGSDGDHLLQRDVIDLVTPFAPRLGREGSKKSTICPKIIDLTGSPIVI